MGGREINILGSPKKPSRSTGDFTLRDVRIIDIVGGCNQVRDVRADSFVESAMGNHCVYGRRGVDRFAGASANQSGVVNTSAHTDR